MSQAQQKFGEPKGIVLKKVFSHLPEVVMEFIREAPFAVLATSNADGDCDASPKGGQPGFVKVLDEKHLLVPDVAGNKLFQSYENVESNAKAGLLFLIPGCEWTARVNGSVSVVDRDSADLAGLEPEVFAPDGNTEILQGMLVEVNEAYMHCPRAFLFSKLWDTDQIARTRDSDPNRRWVQGFMESMES